MFVFIFQIKMTKRMGRCLMLTSEELLYPVAVFRVATDLATCGLPLLESKDMHTIQGSFPIQW